MNALSPPPVDYARFHGTSVAADHRHAAADLVAAIYDEQRDAEDALQRLTDELSDNLWAEGRTGGTPGDLQDKRDEAAAMRAALLAYMTTKAELSLARRASR